MSEKEKSTTDSALAALAKLSEARGPDYVTGLVDGIGIGINSSATAPSVENAEQIANPNQTI